MRNLVATEEEQVTGFAQTESNPWKMLGTGLIGTKLNKIPSVKGKGTGQPRSE